MTPSTQGRVFKSLGAVLLLLAVAGALAIARWASRPPPPARPLPAAQAGTAAPRSILPPQAAAGMSTNATAATAAPPASAAALFSDFRKHPFEARVENGGYAWTTNDGRDPAVIRALAHNELEFERLTSERDRIYRRQLVYHLDTTAAQIERAKLTGEPVRQITLPGMDGQEIRCEIAHSDLAPSGQQGSFSGHVAGQMDSMMTLAFKGGREAFTVLAPADNLYLVGEPREPGEMIALGSNRWRTMSRTSLMASAARVMIITKSGLMPRILATSTVRSCALGS